MFKPILVLVMLLPACGASVAQDAEQQIFLQTEWENCLFEFAQSAAVATEEDAETIRRAAFATCREHEHDYYAFLDEQPDGAIREFATGTLFPAVRNKYGDDVLGVVISARL